MTLRYDSESGQWIDSQENPAVESTVTEAAAKESTVAETVVNQEAFQPTAGVDQKEQTAYSSIPEEPRKKKSRLPLIIGITVVLLLCVGIGTALFLGREKPSQKILEALQNTFKDETHTAKLWEQLAELTKDGYTIRVSGSMEDTALTLEYRNDFKEPQLWGTYEDYSMEEIAFLASLTENKAKMQIPEFSDYVFTYNYKEKKTGYLFEDEEPEAIEILDAALEYLYASNSQRSFDEEIMAILMEEYMSWNFKKAEAKTFKVNGERISCNGYKTVVSMDQLLIVLEEIEDLYKDNDLDYWEEFPDQMENPFDDLYVLLEDETDMGITFYLTEEQVACILMETEDEKMEIIFKGNENGAQDMEIEVDNYSVLEIEHEISQTKEETILSFMGAETLVFTYDYEENIFDLSMEYDYSTMWLSGTLEINEEEMKMALDSLYLIYETVDDLDFEIVVKKGAEIQEMVGEEFDLGKATETEVDDVLSELYTNYLGEDYNAFDEYYSDEYYDDFSDMTPKELYEEYFYDMTPEEFLELFPEYSMEDIIGESDF